jgi:hypothetical protein
MGAFLAWRQHNPPVLYLSVQGIACPNIESAAERSWKNDLPFRGNFGLHRKTILPNRLLFCNHHHSSWLRKDLARAKQLTSGADTYSLIGGMLTLIQTVYLHHGL